MSTAKLWSWDDRNGYWIAVNSGPLDDMQQRCHLMYDTARKANLDGSAFYASPAPPARSPRILGIEVVGEQVKAVLTVDLVSVPKEELERLRGIEQRVRADHETTRPIGDRPVGPIHRRTSYYLGET